MNVIEAKSPWDTANNPPEQEFGNEYFGIVSIEAWHCQLVKGMGKLPFEENAKDENGNALRRYTAIDLAITPLPESGLTFEVSRTMLAEFGEWKDITLPSLKDLGILDASTINSKYANVLMVPTGRKYTNSNGEQKDATGMQFLKVFQDRETCVAAYEAKFGKSKTTTEPAPGNGNGSKSESNGNEKETAAKFAAALVTQALKASGGEFEKARDALGKSLAKQPLVSKYFTVDSPEIVDLLVGGSSGANVWVALKIASELTEPTTIVTVLPDSGIKYLSKIYNDDWMQENNLLS